MSEKNVRECPGIAAGYMEPTALVVPFENYTQAQAEIARLKEAMDFMRGGQWNEVPLLKMEITTLQKQLKVAVEGLKEADGMLTKRWAGDLGCAAEALADIERIGAEK